MSRFFDDDQDDNKDEREPTPRSGRVTFDDRGNAVWDTGRRKGVRVHPNLSLADEEDSPLGEVRHNKVGIKKGYDPYESGLSSGSSSCAQRLASGSLA